VTLGRTVVDEMVHRSVIHEHDGPGTGIDLRGVEIVASAAVASYVARREIKINHVLWRLMIIKCFKEYRRLTKEETGRTGPWHAVILGATALSLTFVAIGLIKR